MRDLKRPASCNLAKSRKSLSRVHDGPLESIFFSAHVPMRGLIRLDRSGPTEVAVQLDTLLIRGAAANWPTLALANTFLQLPLQLPLRLVLSIFTAELHMYNIYKMTVATAGGNSYIMFGAPAPPLIVRLLTSSFTKDWIKFMRPSCYGVVQYTLFLHSLVSVSCVLSLLLFVHS